MTRPRPARAQRLLLVAPPFEYFPGARGTRWTYSRPPLGLAALAAWVRERSRHPVEVCCMDALADRPRTDRELVDRILRHEPDVVGFSVLTASQPIVLRLARALKARRPAMKVILGGPHVTALPEEPAPGADAKIVGEGEIPFLAWLDALARGEAAPEIDGVRRVMPDGEVLPGRAGPRIESLDDLPFPAMDLLPGHAYYHSFPYSGVRRFLTTITSRGCPHDCSFCASRSLWGRRVRWMSADRVLAEVDFLADRHGANLLFFEDDTFTADPDRTRRICEGLLARKERLRWICHTRVDSVDETLVRTMAAAGCVEVQVGVESGDPEVLRRTGKGISLDRAAEAIALFRRQGIHVWATFVLGHAEDTRETMQRTLDAAIALDPTYASFIALLPIPGSRVFRTFRQRGFLDTTDWEAYTWHGKPVFHTDRLTPEDIRGFRSEANRRFYLRPRKFAELAYRTVVSGSSREMVRNFVSWASLVR